MTLTEILLLIYLIMYLYNNNFSNLKKVLNSFFKLFNLKFWKNIIHERKEKLMWKKIDKLPKEFFRCLNDPNCIFVNRGPAFTVDVSKEDNSSVQRVHMIMDTSIKETIDLIDNIKPKNYYNEIKKRFPNFRKQYYQMVESKQGQPFFWFMLNNISVDVQTESSTKWGELVKISTPILHVKFRFAVLSEIEAYKIERIEVLED